MPCMDAGTSPSPWIEGFRETGIDMDERRLLALLVCAAVAAGLVFCRTLGRRRQRDRDRIERKLHTLMDNLPGMAYRCVNQCGVWPMAFVSRGAEALTGYTEAELTSRGPVEFGSLILEQDRAMVDQVVDAAVRNHRAFRMEYRIRRKDGQVRWVWEQGVAIETDGNESMLEGLILDIHERKTAEAKLEQAYRDLHEAHREIRELRGIIPICSGCKRIRNDQGAWEQIEVYIHQHSHAEFSHGLCPACEAKINRDLDLRAPPSRRPPAES